MSLPIFLYLFSFVKFTGPAEAGKSDWEQINKALKPRLAPLHYEISQSDPNNPEQVEQLGDSLSLVIREFFAENEDFFLGEAAKVPGKKYISHNDQTITQLEEKKKNLTKQISHISTQILSDPVTFEAFSQNQTKSRLQVLTVSLT